MTRRAPAPDPTPTRRMRGFEAASRLLAERIRTAGEGRGFAVTRLLTHWAEIVGEDLARVTRPARVGYTREGMGATLTVLAQGAAAPIVEMQKERIRQRVNACYGYNAIGRIALTQSAAAGVFEGTFAGLAEGAAPYAPPPRRADPALAARAAASAEGVRDEGLRQALALLAANILSRNQR